MSFKESSFVAKLEGLDETQEIIVRIGGWVLFNHRYGERIANCWSKFVLEAPSQKQLALVYLANEILQQCKARKKNDLAGAFLAVLPRTVSCAYMKAPKDKKQKIIRVMDVWKQRQVVPQKVLDDITAQIKNGSLAATNASTVPPSSVSQGSIPPFLNDVVTVFRKIDTLDRSLDMGVQKLREERMRINKANEKAIPGPREYLKLMEGVQQLIDTPRKMLSQLILNHKVALDELSKLTLQVQRDLKELESDTNKYAVVLNDAQAETSETVQDLLEMIKEEEEEESKAKESVRPDIEQIPAMTPAVPAHTSVYPPKALSPKPEAQAIIVDEDEDEGVIPTYAPDSEEEEEEEESSDDGRSSSSAKRMKVERNSDTSYTPSISTNNGSVNSATQEVQASDSQNNEEEIEDDDSYVPEMYMPSTDFTSNETKEQPSTAEQLPAGDSNVKSGVPQLDPQVAKFLSDLANS